MKNLFVLIELITGIAGGAINPTAGISHIRNNEGEKFYTQETLLENATELPQSLLGTTLTCCGEEKNTLSFKLKINLNATTAFHSFRYNYYYVVVNDDLTVNPTWKGSYEKYQFVNEDIETFDSYVNRIRNDMSSVKETIYIPSLVTKKECFIMSVSTIIADACTAHDTINNVEYNDWDGIDSIYIPSTITKIESGAFRDVPDDVHIYCEADSKPTGWDENWCDNLSVVDFGVEYAEPKRKEINCDQAPVLFWEATNYITGYTSNEQYQGEEYNLPLVLSYEVTDGIKKETRLYEFEHFSELPYDGVGTFKDLEKFTNFDITLNEGEKIDKSSFKLLNIFYAKAVDLTPNEKDASLKMYTYTVDLENKFYSVPRFSVLIESDKFNTSDSTSDKELIGCGGSISSVGLLLSTLSLAALVFVRKRKI